MFYEERFVQLKDDPRYPTCHASTIAQITDGQLQCAWSAGSGEKSADAAILTSALPPQNRDWRQPYVVVDTPGKPEGNPVLFRDAYGTVWLFFVTMQGGGWETCILRAKPTNDGHTWDPARTIHEEPGWMTRSKPIVTNTDHVILPMYDERDGTAFMLVSTDGGHTWAAQGRIRSQHGVSQPAIAQLSDGTILALLCPGAGNPRKALLRLVSDDGGRNWSTPEPTDLPNPGSAAELVRLRNGHLVLAFNNSSDERTPLTLALSTDDGRTWPVRRDLESGPEEYSFPSVIQGHDELIHVTYTWRREKIKHVTLDEEWIRGEARR